MKKLIIASLFASASFSANAVLIEGSFSGSISSSYDYNNVFGYGAGYNTGLGNTVTGSFWYDTDMAPSDSNGWGQIGQYSTWGNASEWLNITFNVNGQDFSVSNNDFGSYYDGWDLQQVHIRDNVWGQDAFSIYDRDYDYQYSYQGGYTSQRHSSYGGAWIVDSLNDIISGDDLTQSFQWYDESCFDRGGAFLSWHESEYISSQGYSYYESGWFNLNLNEMNVGVKAVNVPEPALGAIFGIGFVGLVLARRRQSRNA